MATLCYHTKAPLVGHAREPAAPHEARARRCAARATGRPQGFGPQIASILEHLREKRARLEASRQKTLREIAMALDVIARQEVELVRIAEEEARMATSRVGNDDDGGSFEIPPIDLRDIETEEWRSE